MGTLDHERSDAFSKIRKHFDTADVVQSDEEILRAVKETHSEARNKMQTTPGGAFRSRSGDARAQAQVSMRSALPG
jgi:hypothetical protein